LLSEAIKKLVETHLVNGQSTAQGDLSGPKRLQKALEIRDAPTKNLQTGHGGAGRTGCCLDFKPS